MTEDGGRSSDSCGNPAPDVVWIFSTSNSENAMDPPPGEENSWSNAAQACMSGSVNVPVGGPSTIHVCAGSLGCQDPSITPGQNSPWQACFPVPPGFEGCVELTAQVTYQGRTNTQRYTRCFDRKPPDISPLPSANTNVNTPSIALSITADKGSDLDIRHL